MNLIIIVIDSLRQDHVSWYAPASPVDTPNLDRFAASSVVFGNMYPEALPTIPIRTQLMTGQRTLPHRPWQPLALEDRTIAEILSREGYVSGLFTDCYHYFKPGYNFHRGFRVWRWIRGQEYDPYCSGPLQKLRLEDHVKESYDAVWRRLVEACLVNVEPFEKAEDHYCARLVAEATQWLEANRDHDRIFCWIDSFDPHEPWTPPPEFDRYTDPGWTGKRLVMPPGGWARHHFDDAEIAYIRGLYAGEVAYVDHYIGQLLGALERLGYFDDSVILLMSDHGHPLADHGKFLKGGDRMYNELLKVPFMLRFPGGEGGGTRLDALAQFHDVTPTLLDALGQGHNIDAMAGRNLMPVIRGDVASVRDTIITGFHAAPDRCVRDQRWSYICRPEGEPDELYDLLRDPGEEHNLVDEHPDEAVRLAGAFGSHYGLGLAMGRFGDYRGELAATAVKGVQGRYEVGGTLA